MKREEAEELLENFEHQITLDANGVLSDMGRQNLYCARQEILAALTQESVTPDKYRALESIYIEQGAIIEAIYQILDGEEVSDFMLSFGVVRAAWDAVHNVTPKEPTIPTEPGKYVMSVEVEVREGLCGLIMWVPGILCMVSVDYFRGATFERVEEGI